jgi:hypothetical protein
MDLDHERHPGRGRRAGRSRGSSPQGLVFAGTERGVYVSFDDGARWQPLQLNLPMSPVHDLAIKNDDLIVATHGRSFWILDDIAPLRQAASVPRDAGVFLYKPRNAWRLLYSDHVDRQRIAGQNPPPGAVIDYYLRSEPKEEVTLEIRDATGALVRRFTSKEEKKEAQPPEWPDLMPHENRLPAKAGMNRFVWDIRWEDPVQVPGAFYWGNPPTGPIALPGTYTVTLAAGAFRSTERFDLEIDPRASVAPADLRRQFDLSVRITARTNDLHQAVNAMRDLKAQFLVLKKRAKETEGGASVLAPAEALEKRIASIEEKLIQVRLRSSEGLLAFPSMLNEQLYSLGYAVESADTPPAQPLIETFEALSRQIEAQLVLWRELASRDVPALNEAASKAAIPWVSLGPTPGGGRN